MKSNVDLTANNKFSINRPRIPRKFISMRSPWLELDGDTEQIKREQFKRIGFRDDKREQINTGNKITRKQKHISNHFQTETCDCCARDLTRLGGWRVHYQLCWECDQQLVPIVNMNDRCLWRKSEFQPRPFWL